MFIPININAQDIIGQFDISREECESIIDYTIKEITASFAAEWENTANRELKGTKERYVHNLRVVDEGRMQGAVILDYSKDSLIQMLEEGASPFDMKENFAKSAKKHEKKDGGWYLTIPFKIGTPGSQTASGFATVMPSQIYNLIKNKPIKENGDKSKGLTAMDIGSGGGVPEQFQIPTARKAIVNIPTSAAFKEYQHKSNIYQGLFKQQDKTTGQSSYGSFRRVSDLSDADSWIHPGLEAKNLAERAYSVFEAKEGQILEDAMNAALNAFGLE